MAGGKQKDSKEDIDIGGPHWQNVTTWTAKMVHTLLYDTNTRHEVLDLMNQSEVDEFISTVYSRKMDPASEKDHESPEDDADQMSTQLCSLPDEEEKTLK